MPNDTNTRAELAPCPFCGAAADYKLHDGDADEWIVRCVNPDCTCWPSTDCYRGLDAAIAAWNRRASAAPGGEPIRERCEHGVRWENRCGSCDAPPSDAGQRVWLTDEQVAAGHWNRYFSDDKGQRAMFKAGVRFAEEAHGIRAAISESEGSSNG